MKPGELRARALLVAVCLLALAVLIVLTRSALQARCRSSCLAEGGDWFEVGRVARLRVEAPKRIKYFEGCSGVCIEQPDGGAR